MSVTRIDVTGGTRTNTSPFAPTLPTHQAGDRLLLFVVGKYQTATVATINQGWTVIRQLTGGTGAHDGVTADVGDNFTFIYAKDATSSSETAPTVTWGATVPNAAQWWCVSHRPTAGSVWRDSIGATAGWTKGYNDSNTAANLNGTTAAFTGFEAQTGDAIFLTGTVPTDTGSAMTATPTLTSTGLSGGTKTLATGQYEETAMGTNSAAVWAGWTGFTGPQTAGVLFSAAITGSSNHSGLVGVTVLRVTPGDFTEDFEGAANTVQATTSTTTFDGAADTASTMTHSTLHAIAGTRSLRIHDPTTSINLYQSFFPARTVNYSRTYFYSDDTTNGSTILSVASGGTQGSNLQWSVTANRFRLRDGSTVTDTSTMVPATGQWYRIELFTDTAAGTHSARIFTGANLHGTTPDETLTGSTTTGTFDSCIVGTNSTNVLDWFWDGYAQSATTWVGPLAGVVKTGTATGTRGWVGTGVGQQPPVTGGGNIVRIGTRQAQTNTTNTTGTRAGLLPSGRAVGDLLLAFLDVNRDVTLTSGTPTGWTLVDNLIDDADSATRTWIYRRIADNTSTDIPSWDWSQPTAVALIVDVQIAVYRGVNQTTPFIVEDGVIEGGSDVTVHSAPSITNTDPDAWGVFHGMFRGGVSLAGTPMSWVPGSGLVERLDQDGPLNTMNNICATTADTGGAFATGAKVFSGTSSQATNNATMWAAFLKPESTVPNAGTGTGAVGWVGSATGKKLPRGTGSGTVAWVGSAFGQDIGRGTGAVAWVGSATGRTTHKATAAGAIAWVGLANGRTTSNSGAGLGTIAWVGAARSAGRGTATGTMLLQSSAAGVHPGHGIATGLITQAGTVTGRRASRGAATGTVAWVGASTGAGPGSGTGSGLIPYPGAVPGRMRPGVARPASTPIAPTISLGNATGAVTYTGSATGRKVPKGTATGAVTWAGAAFGKNIGRATGAIAWVGAATGVRLPHGAATGTLTWNGTARGLAAASATGAIAWVGSSTGARRSAGTGLGTITWAGTAVGFSPGIANLAGFALGTVTWAGTADGQSPRLGAATGTITWAGSAVAQAPRIGTATGTLDWAGTVLGQYRRLGDATGTIDWVGSAFAQNVGAATGGHSLVGTSTGARVSLGAATRSVIWVGTATGRKPVIGTATGTVTWAGTVVGVTPAFGPVTGLTATPVSISAIDLAWLALNGATFYEIERDGVIIATPVVGLTYSDTGLDEDTLYCYRVRGVI